MRKVLAVLVALILITVGVGDAMAEGAKWHETENGCRVKIPSTVTFAANAIKSIKWVGVCFDGMAQGDGLLKITFDNYLELKGRMVNGEFRGIVDYTKKQYEGAFYGSGSSFHILNDVGMSKDQYEKKISKESSADKKKLAEIERKIKEKIAESQLVKDNDGCLYNRADLKSWYAKNSWYDFIARYVKVESSKWEGECVNGKASGSGKLNLTLTYTDSLDGRANIDKYVLSGVMVEGRFRGPIYLDGGYRTGINYFYQGKQFKSTEEYKTYLIKTDDKEAIAQLNSYAKERPSFLKGVELVNINGIKLTKEDNFGLIGDTRTGLIWSRCALGRKWDTIAQQCEGDATRAPWLNMVILVSKEKYAGFNDWRLPTAAEYKALLGVEREYNSREECAKLNSTLSLFFPNIHSEAIYQGNHWLADNTADMMRPLSADMRPAEYGLMQNLGCPTVESALRPIATQPAIMVRGGAVPEMWKVALSKSPKAQALYKQSLKDSKAYWSGVNQKFKEIMTAASSSGSSPSDYCGSSDKCFEIVEKIDNSTWKIKCTKGQYKGNEDKVCSSTGKHWAKGCGVTDTFAYHYSSMEEAGNKACGR